MYITTNQSNYLFLSKATRYTPGAFCPRLEGIRQERKGVWGSVQKGIVSRY